MIDDSIDDLSADAHPWWRPWRARLTGRALDPQTRVYYYDSVEVLAEASTGDLSRADPPRRTGSAVASAPMLLRELNDRPVSVPQDADDDEGPVVYARFRSVVNGQVLWDFDADCCAVGPHSPTLSAGTHNDLTGPPDNVTIIAPTLNGPVTLTGIDGLEPGVVYQIINPPSNDFTLTLAHDSPLSAEGNRFGLSTGGDRTLSPGEGGTFYYGGDSLVDISWSLGQSTALPSLTVTEGGTLTVDDGTVHVDRGTVLVTDTVALLTDVALVTDESTLSLERTTVTVGTEAPQVPLKLTATAPPGDDDTVQTVLVMESTTATAPAVPPAVPPAEEFGLRIQWDLENNLGIVVPRVADLVVQWGDPTDGLEVADLVIHLMHLGDVVDVLLLRPDELTVTLSDGGTPVESLSLDPDDGLTVHLVNPLGTTSLPVLTLQETTAATPSPGLGPSIAYKIEDSAGNNDTAGKETVAWTDATHGSEDAQYTLTLVAGGTLTPALHVDKPGAVRLPETSTPPTPAANHGTLWFDTTGDLNVINDAGTVTNLTDGAASAAAGPAWRKFTKSYSDLATGAATNSVTLTTLTTRQTVHTAVIKHSASFTGGTLTEYFMSVGFTGSPTYLVPGFNVFIAPSANDYYLSTSTQIVPTFGGSQDVTLSASSTGGNLDQATQGSVDVWLLISTLP